VDTNSLTPGQVAALLEMLAMVDLPGDGEVVDGVLPEGFIQPIISVQEGVPCAVPCKKGTFVKTFYKAKYNGVCWLCKDEVHDEMIAGETLITRWGAGWVTFSCFLKDAASCTAHDMVEKQQLMLRYDNIFIRWLETYPKIRHFLGINNRVSIPSKANKETMRNSIGRALNGFSDLAAFVNKIEGKLI